MTLSPPYPKPPITEAVIDIRIKSPHSSVERLEKLAFTDYPARKPKIEFQGSLLIGPEVSTTTSQRQLGFSFMDKTQKKVLQATIGGFTFSQLAPYTSWDFMKSEARKLWALYRENAEPEQITRIAVRYVNRLDLPFPFDDFNQFLRTYPEVSPGISQQLSSFFMTFDSPQTDIKAMLKLNQAPVPPPSENIVSVMLDIDLFRVEDVPQTDDAIWDEFEQLRQRKNAVFEACITDKARELFR